MYHAQKQTALEVDLADCREAYDLAEAYGSAQYERAEAAERKIEQAREALIPHVAANPSGPTQPDWQALAGELAGELRGLVWTVRLRHSAQKARALLARYYEITAQHEDESHG
jgi:hypothetical protein